MLVNNNRNYVTAGYLHFALDSALSKQQQNLWPNLGRSWLNWNHKNQNWLLNMYKQRRHKKQTKSKKIKAENWVNLRLLWELKRKWQAINRQKLLPVCWQAVRPKQTPTWQHTSSQLADIKVRLKVNYVCYKHYLCVHFLSCIK